MDIKKIRKSLKLSQQEFGDLLGISRFTIMNYEKNGAEIPEKQKEYIKQFLEKMNYSENGRFSILGFVNEPEGEYNSENPEFARHKRYIEFLEKEIKAQDEKIKSMKEQMKELLLENQELIKQLPDLEDKE